jgi:hypothetical protein
MGGGAWTLMNEQIMTAIYMERLEISIHKAECLWVGGSVLYTNLHRCTVLNKIVHTWLKGPIEWQWLHEILTTCPYLII